MFDFDLDLDLGSRRQPREWAVAVQDVDMPHKPPKRRTQRERKQSKRERKAAHASGTQQPAAQLTPAQAKYRKEFRDPNVVCLSTEIENGNVEYKYNLTGCATNPNRRHQLTTQMKFRLSEGGGECFYYIGVEDDGYPRGLEPKELAGSISLLQNMAGSLSATARLVEYVPGGFGATAALLHVKANAEEDMRATDLRVAVAGSMDAGKSTLVAVLTHGSDGRPLLDNCRGSARMAVFRHKHEIESGRTSSISQQVLGYDQEGRVLNYVGVAVPTPADITAAAHQLVQFIDMGGHEKYLKTTLYGMTCMLPDYVLLCVDAVCGVTRITREHLAVAVALEVPTALVVTKADAVDSKQLQAVLEQLRQLMMPVLNSCSSGSISNVCSSQEPALIAGAAETRDRVSEGLSRDSSCNRVISGVPVVTSDAQAATLAATLSDLHSCTAAGTAASFQQATFPVFTVSCVTGSGLPLLHAFLSKLRPVSTLRRADITQDASAEGSKAGPSAVQLDPGQGYLQDSTTAARAKQVKQTQGELESTHNGVKLLQPTPQLLSREGSSQLWLPGDNFSLSGSSSNGSAAGVDSHKLAEPARGPAAAGAAAAAAAGHFQVVHTYDVEGVGWVVSGIAVAGTIEVGQSLLWGPTTDGGFSPVSVSCIQRSHVPVRQVQPGQTATIALQPVGPDGQPLGSSKEALLSAAAAAQAAAEEQAAREAAAACAAAPTIAFGKPFKTPAAGAAGPEHAAANASASGVAAAQESAAQGPPAVAAKGLTSTQPSVSDSKLDLLADDLAASLALDEDDDSQTAAPCGASEADSFDAIFGGYSGTAKSDKQQLDGSISRAVSSRSSSFSWSEGLAGYSSSSNLTSATTGPAGVATAGAAAGVEAAVGPPGTSQPIPAAKHAAAATDASFPVPLGCSPSGCRSKGAVLLDAAAAPCTYWEFEALLVLLGGHWPARGLLSGAWPPAEPDRPAAEQGSASSQQPVAAAAVAIAEVAPAVTAAIGDLSEDVGIASERQPLTEQQQAQQMAKEVNQTTAAAVGAKSGRRRPAKCRSKRYDYAYVIHCNSIRQIARIVHMRELRQPGDQQQLESSSSTSSSTSCSTCTSSSSSTGSAVTASLQQQTSPDGACAGTSTNVPHYCGGLSASIQAAAALLQNEQQWDSPCGVDTGSSSGGGKPRSAGSSRRRKADAMSDLGSVVCVRFRFTHRPEWMQVGARLIVRDRSDGHVAAAGFVTRLLEPHTRQQQQGQ